MPNWNQNILVIDSDETDTDSCGVRVRGREPIESTLANSKLCCVYSELVLGHRPSRTGLDMSLNCPTVYKRPHRRVVKGRGCPCVRGQYCGRSVSTLHPLPPTTQPFAGTTCYYGMFTPLPNPRNQSPTSFNTTFLDVTSCLLTGFSL
ncbi:hypothetical protein J6590_015806 [Homalodisca vitripennis]|nr:hypothetical protein J6590_015806 [Homalodisca vitripennis]